MKKILIILIFCFYPSLILTARSQSIEMEPVDSVRLQFQLELEPEVYIESAWGDPPQLAIWMVNLSDSSGQTVVVTHRTGRCDWDGKMECGVALPWWELFYNKLNGTFGLPTWNKPAPDAITCATPRTTLSREVYVLPGSHWRYFLEINVSGDFNLTFPHLDMDGVMDNYGNGRPSLVYRGKIEAVPGQTSKPVILGRTDQHEPVEELISNMEGMEMALKLVKNFSVNCFE